MSTTLAKPTADRAELAVDQSAIADPVIETRGLHKTYGGVTALDRLDLSIPHSAVGLLGANGAGKTTLIRLLLGLARPDGGDARVLGLDAWKQGVVVRERVGYMPESDCLPPGVTAADFVGHMAEMSGLPSRAARQRAADVLYQVGLDEERYRLIKGFSTGMKQRVKLAQAIVHDPGLVFLDEPTNGMDPRGREEMLELIVRIHQTMGMAVVVSSHILEDIERVCHYVVILDGGRVVASQAIDRAALAPDSIGGDLMVRIDASQADEERFLRHLGGLGVTAHPVAGERTWGELVVSLDDDRVFDAVRDAAADLDLPLRALRPRARSLEDLYLGRVGLDPHALPSNGAEAPHGGD